MLENAVLQEPPVGERGILQMEEKKLICRKAAGFIGSNDTLFIDNSSTMIYLPQYISPDLYITIITNSISFLHEASKVGSNNWLLICLGGIFKTGNLSVHGAETMKNADPYYPTKVFFSCAGVSPVNKLADSSPHEVEVKRMMIDRAQEVFLLVDHTKFEKIGQIFICDFSSVDHIITDKPIKSSSQNMDFLNGFDILVAD
jgi:DeoR family fructose operon transcriptional repressor